MLNPTRREFITQLSAIGAGLYVAPTVLVAQESSSPNEKLNIGVVGPGGRGHSNLRGVSGQNIVALCDVDQSRAGQAFEEFPKATKYADFRKMLENETLDAVVVSTPDHTHAPASYAAMKRGLHCYCEKPLTRTVSEARLLTTTAAEKGLATQMGTQIHAGDNYRRVVEIVRSGAIGNINKVDVWVGKGWGGVTWPKEPMPVPAGVDWDLWLGAAPWRPYHRAYMPADWRRWWDFGGGTLGDMGCHYMDLAFWALDLGRPNAVQSEGPPPHPETTPSGIKVTWDFPERLQIRAGDGLGLIETEELPPKLPPVQLTWTDGDLVETEHDGHKLGGSGVYFYGDKGSMFADYGSYKLFPEEEFNGYEPPEPSIPRSTGHYEEWITACKTGSPTTCNFDYSGALTEAVLLGNVAFRLGKRLEWDAANLTATNAPEANVLIHHAWRPGWDV